MTLKELIAKHKAVWGDRSFVISALLATTFFFASLALNDLAGHFATMLQSNHVSDFILETVPVVDVTPLISVGSVFLALSVPVLMTLEPRRIPYTGYTMGLFILIRAAFVCLTHTAVPLGSIGHDGPFFRAIGLSYTGDLFFSGHTGGPFLLSLIFIRHPRIRWTYVATSIFLGVMMLLAHAHYSIDVFAAFFISYAIFHLSLTCFPRARRIFKDGLLPTEVEHRRRTDS